MSVLRDMELELEPETEAALEKLVEQLWLAESVKAQVEQEEFARACRAENLRSIEGVGQMKRAVHPFAWHDWALKLNSYDCWRDTGFLKYFDRIAPECRVKSKGTRIQVGFERHSEMAPKRFTKRYETPNTQTQTPEKSQAPSSEDVCTPEVAR